MANVLGLQKNYVQVNCSGRLSYGGSQMWSPSETIRVCGCGPVAVLDTLLYLRQQQGSPISQEEYNKKLERLSRRYMPLIPPFGANGLLVAAGMNMLLREYHLPYRAFWAVSRRKFWTRMEDLLRQDLPVIFSIGPNFPAVWSKHRLTFYGKKPDGTFVPVSSAKAHYITATGMDEEWLRISSWGRQYYIKRSEYDEYVRKYSASLVSNILMLRRIE